MEMHHSPLMEKLGAIWLVSHDIGGWLFPDFPDSENSADEDVVEFVTSLITLWGSTEQFVVTNVRSAKGWKKNITLLEENCIQDRCGFLKGLGYFVAVESPEEKGKVMARKKAILQYPTFTAFVAMFDNRFRAMFNSPADTHRFLFRPKDRYEKDVIDWFEKNRPAPTRLYVSENIPEMARAVARIHLAELRTLLDASTTISRKFGERLWHAEIERTETIFGIYGIKSVTEQFRK